MMRTLLLTSKTPQFRGMGSNMRAGAHVLALSGFSDLRVIVASYEPLLDLNEVADNLTRATADIRYFCSQSVKSRLFFASTQSPSGTRRLGLRLLSGPRETVGLTTREVRRLAPDAAECDVLMAFRLSMAPAALRLATLLGGRGRRVRTVLDLDDIDSLRMRRQAASGRLQSGRLWTSMERFQAAQVEHQEDRMIPRFDRVFVCSDADAELLNRKYGRGHVHALPNAVALPERLATARGGARPTIGFVGSMDYFPNFEAVTHFCRSILPRIREQLGEPLRFVVVGRNPPPEVLGLASEPGIEVTGTVPDVAPYYAQFDLTVAPIRSGGGTRIKILEAFAFGRPVVATTVGAEGIEARNGDSIFIADEPDAFAARCVQLLKDEALRDSMAAAGRRLVEERYSMAAIGEVLRASFLDLHRSA